MQKEQTSNELVVLVDNSELQKGTRELLLTSFLPFLEQAKEWRVKAEALIVTDGTQLTEMKQAREGRLALRLIRTQADKKRKELKEDSNRYNKAVQSVYNAIEAVILPIEEHLEKQEKFAEIAEANRKELLHNERVALLQPYRVDYLAYDLRNMPEDTFKQLLQGSKLAYEKAVEEAASEQKRLEQERILAEEAQKQRLEDQRIENERLKLEIYERGKALAEQKEKADAELKAEREKNEKIRLELLAKKQHEDEQKAAAEKQQKAEQKAAKKLAAAPDKDKLAILILQLEKLVYPDVKTEEAVKIVDDTKVLINKVINHVKTKTSEL
jgi:fused signal recognition particle receptor